LRQKVKVFEDVDKEKNSQLNQLGNMLNKLGKRLDKLENSIDSNKDIIARLEQYLKFESSEKIDLTIKKDTEAEKEPSEKELYLLAKMAFDQGDFETAREEFGKFLTKYPKSERADNAQYWISEIYYREKWYEKAILEYQKVIENYPKGNKVPDSLLKQGFAFNNIGDKANARLVFKELIEKYPKSEQTKVAKEKSKEIGL
jgi:tol-pal system protein YbgF